MHGKITNTRYGIVNNKIKPINDPIPSTYPTILFLFVFLYTFICFSSDKQLHHFFLNIRKEPGSDASVLLKGHIILLFYSSIHFLTSHITTQKNTIAGRNVSPSHGATNIVIIHIRDMTPSI